MIKYPTFEEFWFKYHINRESPRRLRNLIGKYYICIFDEKNGGYDIEIKHCHKIIDAYYINKHNYIYDGILLRLASIREVLSGVVEKFISYHRKPPKGLEVRI